jgi:hypothetical protein
MSEGFFQEVGIPEQDIFLNVGSGSYAVQTVAVMTAFEKVGVDENPEYRHSYRITYFRGGSTFKMDEKGWGPILFGTITDTKDAHYIFSCLTENCWCLASP